MPSRLDEIRERMTARAQAYSGSVVDAANTDIAHLLGLLDTATKAMQDTRSMLAGSVQMVEFEMGPEGAKRFSGTDPIGVVADLYGRMAPMCQALDAALARLKDDIVPVEKPPQPTSNLLGLLDKLKPHLGPAVEALGSEETANRQHATHHDREVAEEYKELAICQAEARAALERLKEALR